METHASVRELAEEWDDLATRTAARPWFRAGWFDCWWRAFGSGELRIFAARRDGRLVGVLPLVRHGRTLSSAANWHSPEFGMLAEDGDARAAIAAAVFADRPPRLAVWLLGEDRGLAELRAEAKRRGTPTSERVQLRSPWVPLDDEQLAARPSKKRRKELDRCRRRLEDREGEVTLDVQESLDDASLAEGLELEGSGWKVEHGTAIVSDATLVSFYTELGRWTAGDGILRLCFLRAGGKAIAFEYVFDDGRSHYDLKGGYDVAYREYSPGLLVAQDLIRYAHEQGRRTYELLGDVEQFKLTWTDLLRERVLFQAYARSPLGLAAYARERHLRPLAKRVLRR